MKEIFKREVRCYGVKINFETLLDDKPYLHDIIGEKCTATIGMDFPLEVGKKYVITLEKEEAPQS